MKTVILSDTHLSNKVNTRKFDYLKSLIENTDKVVLAGDFWDGFATSFDNFLNSKWRELFPLLLEKQAVYLYGNHDRPEWCDYRTKLFSVEQGMSTNLNVDGRDYFVTHGHTLFEPFENWPEVHSKVVLKLCSNIDATRKFFQREQLPEEGSTINMPMSKWAADNLSEDQMLVCGHSHYPEIDFSNRFVNSGFIGRGFGTYAVIDGGGPQIVKERY